MTTAIPPIPPIPPINPAAARNPRGGRWRRLRPRGRGAAVGAAVLALLIAGGVAGALLTAGRGDDGGHVDLAGGYGDLALADFGGPDGLGGPEGLGGLVGPDGPGSVPGDGPGRGRRGGEPGRGLGDDTLVAGTVVSVGDGTLVVTPDGGAQRTIRTDDRTRVRGDGNTALGDVAPGERVVVRVRGTGDAAVAAAVVTPRARVVGTVTALAADRATVVGLDGLTVTADVSGLAEKPVVGDVVALGGVAADPNTLRADRVKVLTKAP